MSRLSMLVVYDYAPVGPMRATIRDHLYSFKKNTKHHIYYLNLAYRTQIPWHLFKIQFDVVIFHTIFFTTRWDEAGYERTRHKAQFLKQIKALKVGFPQDEHFKTDYICDLINEFEMDFIFTVSPKSEWEKFYSGKLRKSVKFKQVLTGYLDDQTLSTIERMAKSADDKTIDIGYRASHVAPSLGRHGRLKPLIAEVFQQEGEHTELILDISTKPEDTILGDAWFKFLLECKYTIGVEGGASLIDRDGQFRKKSQEYLKQHPHASFEEVEEFCFPGQDGYLQYFALSPRHLEACATRTCQILIEGEYNGVLQSGVHYIELKRDLSNIDEVIELIKKDERRDAIVERAYRDIVSTGRYSYRGFVEEVMTEVIANVSRRSGRKEIYRHYLFCWWNWLRERNHQRKINLTRKIRSLRKRFG